MQHRSTRFAAVMAVALAAWQSAPAALAQTSSVQEIVVRAGHHVRDPDVELRKQTINYADLDLNRDAGALVMLQRIRSAAKKVCEPEATTLAERAAYKTCYDGSLSDALSSLHNARVSGLYASGA